MARTPKVDFRVPEGMTVIAIDRKTGMRANPGDPNVIMEAFSRAPARPTAIRSSAWTRSAKAPGCAAVPAGNPRDQFRFRRTLLTRQALHGAAYSLWSAALAVHSQVKA
ncbi:hypothetical protein VXQ18_16480 [Brucella abortus]|nr:hypothetical protein [Brucella abortus]